MVYFLVVILALGLAAAIAYIFMMRSELSRLVDAMEQNHTTEAVRPLTIGTRQPQIVRIAASVNTMYEDIDAYRAMNRVSVEEIRQSIVNISHDLRTPLTSLIGYLKLMQNDSVSAEKKHDYQKTAYQKALILNSLVSGLFELAVLENGGYIFQYQRVDANAVLAEELTNIYAQFEIKSISPMLQLYDAPLWVIGDSDALHRVFANLLQNMVKHGSPPIQITSDVEKGTVNFRLSNRAPNLLPKDIPLLFRRFFTADRMRSGKDTGLGLAIVKELVEQMNGHVSAELDREVLTISLFFDLGTAVK